MVFGRVAGGYGFGDRYERDVAEYGGRYEAVGNVDTVRVDGGRLEELASEKFDELGADAEFLLVGVAHGLRWLAVGFSVEFGADFVEHGLVFEKAGRYCGRFASGVQVRRMVGYGSGAVGFRND